MLLQHTDVWSCFLRMMIFCLFLCVLLYSQHGHCSHICPKNCICEQATSVQCFRAQAVPPVVSNKLKKIHLGYNHLRELKVLFSSLWLCWCFICYSGLKHLFNYLFICSFVHSFIPSGEIYFFLLINFEIYHITEVKLVVNLNISGYLSLSFIFYTFVCDFSLKVFIIISIIINNIIIFIAFYIGWF